jgi:hypothetical protein
MFNVRVQTNRDDKVLGYLVSDKPEIYDDENGYAPWPPAAEFRVSLRYSDETQRRRAWEYCDYLNKGIVIQPPIGA